MIIAFIIWLFCVASFIFLVPFSNNESTIYVWYLLGAGTLSFIVFIVYLAKKNPFHALLAFIILPLISLISLLGYSNYRESVTPAIPVSEAKNQYHTCYYKGRSAKSMNPCDEWVKVLDIYCKTFQDGIDMDCSDFDSQSSAQETIDNSILCTGNDVYRLDGDHDGIACESLR